MLTITPPMRFSLLESEHFILQGKRQPYLQFTDKLDRIKGWDPINQFNHATICMPTLSSQALDLQCHVYWSLLCLMV
jgi:hypothetical protein